MKHIFLGKSYENKYFLGVIPCPYIYSDAYKKADIYNRTDHLRYHYLEHDYEIDLLSKDLFVNEKNEINFDENRHDFKGKICNKIIFVDYFVAQETDNLLRELEVNENIYIENKSYKISDKSYGVNKEVVYYINFEKKVDNEESLMEATEALRKRQEFLKNKKEENLDSQVTENQIEEEIQPKCTGEVEVKKVRKWWQRIFDEINKNDY